MPTVADGVLVVDDVGVTDLVAVLDTVGDGEAEGAGVEDAVPVADRRPVADGVAVGTGVGDTVQVAAGPLQGLEGKYLAHDGETRAFVLIELLGQPQKLRMEMETLRVV